MSYQSVISADLPTNWWRMSDGGGAIATNVSNPPRPLHGPPDESGYSGVASDGGSFVALGRSGDGRFTYDALSQSTPLSVEFWCWFFNSNTTTWVVCAWDNVTNPSFDAAFVAGLVPNFSINAIPLNTVAVTARAWHHYVVAADNVDARLYIDGALKQTGATGSPFTINRQIGWGNTLADNLRPNCFLTECAIYGTKLSAAQVSAHFNAADAVSSAPAYHLPGSADSTTGSFTGFSLDLSDILSSVRKTFPAT